MSIVFEDAGRLKRFQFLPRSRPGVKNIEEGNNICIILILSGNKVIDCKFSINYQRDRLGAIPRKRVFR